ncbi:hypothetical protein A6A03_05620 [Chloroflexus islandicus]|uniref:Uncharacterized protein n=1 Tax=Chloroflexus islandicus TaxID=1707952 RepID=A0A178LU31_9CHLR|nr:hypothetical protein A6A03_05620 [Chloroflexus islandicus]
MELRQETAAFHREINDLTLAIRHPQRVTERRDRQATTDYDGQDAGIGGGKVLLWSAAVSLPHSIER